MIAIYEQIEEAIPFDGIKSSRGLVNDQQLGASRERDRNAESLLHAARVAAGALLPHVVQIGLVQQRRHQILPLTGIDHAFERGEMIEDRLRRHVRIQAELPASRR